MTKSFFVFFLALSFARRWCCCCFASLRDGDRLVCFDWRWRVARQKASCSRSSRRVSLRWRRSSRRAAAQIRHWLWTRKLKMTVNGGPVLTLLRFQLLFFFSRFSVCIGWPSVPSLIERTRCQASRVATTLRIAAARLLRSRQRSSRDSPFAWRRAPRRASAMQPLWRASASRQASANGRASYPKDLVRILQQ